MRKSGGEEKKREELGDTQGEKQVLTTRFSKKKKRSTLVNYCI